MRLINILTQETEVPLRIGSIFCPNFETLKQFGWRKLETEALPVAEGYTRIGNVYYQQDSENEDNAIAIVNDILTSVIEQQNIEQSEAYNQQMIEIEANRQNDKPLELKKAENAFLDICELLTGKKDKLGFGELEAIINNLMTTNQNQAVVLSIKLLSIDAQGKRSGGLTWWDDCIYHNDITG